MRPYPKNRWQGSDDPLVTSQHRQFTQQRNQALYRDEGWELAWEDWIALWKPKWHLRGRSAESMCMVRKDYTKTWSLDNVELVMRGDHVRKQHQWKRHLKMQEIDRKLTDWQLA